MTINPELLKAYARYRRLKDHNSRSFKRKPADCLARAREDIAAGKPQYGSGRFYPAYEGAVYNPAMDDHYGYRNIRWVEDAGHLLRFVGYADEIAKAEYSRAIDHKGWFISEFMDETYRGVVYQLPSRHHGQLFAFGYADPNNDGAALLCFDLETDKMDAARAADRFAEISAEHEREYQEANQASQQYRDLADEAAAARKAALALLIERKAQRPVGAIEKAIRDRVSDYLDTICKARKERAELLAGYGRQEGWEN